MFFLTGLLILGCLAPKVQGDCFDMKKLILVMEDDMKKAQVPVLEKCKKDNPTFDADEVQDCYDKKFDAAHDKCEEKHGDDEDAFQTCVNRAMGITFVAYNTYANVKNQFLKSLADKSKQKKIEQVFTSCKAKEKKGEKCFMKKLKAGPCPELKKYFPEA